MEERKVLRIYVRIAKQAGFKPLILKEVVFLKSKGLSNVEIANSLGVSRNTVSNYLDKLKEMHEEQFAELVSLIGIMHARRKEFLKNLE